MVSSFIQFILPLVRIVRTLWAAMRIPPQLPPPSVTIIIVLPPQLPPTGSGG